MVFLTKILIMYCFKGFPFWHSNFLICEQAPLRNYHLSTRNSTDNIFTKCGHNYQIRTYAWTDLQALATHNRRIYQSYKWDQGLTVFHLCTNERCRLTNCSAIVDYINYLSKVNTKGIREVLKRSWTDQLEQ